MKEEKFPHVRSPFAGRRLRVAEWGELQSRRGENSNRGAGRDSRTEDWCRQALTSPRGLSAHLVGLGAEARASVGAPGEDWGWRREHSLQGVTAPRLAGRESGKMSGPAEEARDFFLPLCFLVRKERGLRALLKGAPDTGASCGYQRGHQRQT